MAVVPCRKVIKLQRAFCSSLCNINSLFTRQSACIALLYSFSGLPSGHRELPLDQRLRVSPGHSSINTYIDLTRDASGFTMSRKWIVPVLLAILADRRADSGSDDDSEYDSDNPDYQQVREAESPQPTETTLRDAITAAPLERLQKLLLEITEHHEDARIEAMAKLLQPIPGSNGKRKAYEMCANCANEYNVSENEVGVCVFHEGTVVFIPTKVWRALMVTSSR